MYKIVFRWYRAFCERADASVSTKNDSDTKDNRPRLILPMVGAGVARSIWQTTRVERPDLLGEGMCCDTKGSYAGNMHTALGDR